MRRNRFVLISMVNVTVWRFTNLHISLRDWSLITGRGGYETGGRRACEVLPLRKGVGGGQRKKF